MTVKKLIKILLDYPMDTQVVINGIVDFKDLEEINYDDKTVSLGNQCKFDLADTELFENVVFLSAGKRVVSK